MDKNDIKSMSFEQALEGLETIIARLESGDIPLEESIEAYEKGVALKTHCESKLKAAQLKIEKIMIKPDGKVTTEPFDPRDNQGE